MTDLKELEVKIFDLFRSQWAIVSAGDKDDHNGCTVSWGSMGTLWTRKDGGGSMVTVYIHPARHTINYLKNNDTFTVSFFPKEARPALSYMGSRSGRDEDKIKNAGLTLDENHNSVVYNEANLTLVCRKMYCGQFEKDGLNPDIQNYYKNNPNSYPVDEEGNWQPHFIFVGEVTEVIEK